MKKLFLTLALAFGMFAANAQVWLGGSVNATMQKHESRFGIAPEVGYGLNDHINIPLTVALAADFGYYTNEFDNTATLTLTPYVRYMVTEIGEKFSFSLDLLGEIGVANVDGFKIGIRPVIAWMATDHWTAAFSMGFLGYDDMYHNKAFCIDLETAAPRFGLYYNF